MKKCSSCGAELAADAPGGHCVACLLRLGLAVAEAGALTLKPGDRVGNYILAEPLGEGGCGVVFWARQEEPVRREVALKVIKLGMDTAQVLARFDAERQVLALLDHPNIAKVLDAGATEAGRPFFVMELVRGVKITEYCDRNKLATRERLELFVQICHAVQHAHQKGIIHRDLKPSNILVIQSENGAAVPKIIDFGIAKSTGQRLTEQTLFTAFEQFLGTPAYMSPEQAGMMEVDTRSDIYSLGVLLYELLTGLAPFDAAVLQRCAMDKVLRFIRETEPPRPSTRLTGLSGAELTTVAGCRRIEAARLPRLLRGDLDWIVMKCLEKDRARRYETVSGLGADLEHHLRDEPVEARPPSGGYRLRKMARRHRVAFAAAGAVVAALVLGLGISMWFFFKEKVARGRAVRAEATERGLREMALTEAGKSREVAKFLEAMLEGVGPSVALGRDTVMLREILDATDARISRDLKDQPEVEAELRSTLAETYRELGDYQPMAAMARRELELTRAKGGTESKAVARALAQLGGAELHLGQLAAAEAADQEALRMRRKILGDADPEVGGSLNDLAEVLRAMGRLSEAEGLLREALALQRKLAGQDGATVATTLSNLGGTLWSEKKFAEAEADYREVLEMRRKLLGAERPEVAMALNNLATVFLSEEKFVEAEKMNRAALEMQRKYLGNGHPAVAVTLGNLANALVAQQKFAEAETADREALEITRGLPGVGSKELAMRLENLGKDLVAQGRGAEAGELFKEAGSLGK